MHLSSDISLGVLAGGSGIRLGGRDKGLICVRGTPLIDHVIRELSSQVDEVIINCRANAAFYSHYGSRLVGDRYPDRGPAVGVGAVMSACSTPLLFVVAVDLYAPLQLILSTLYASHHRDGASCFASDMNGWHQPAVLLRLEDKQAVTDYLDRGGASLKGLYAAISAKPTPVDCHWRDVDVDNDLASLNWKAKE